MNVDIKVSLLTPVNEESRVADEEEFDIDDMPQGTMLQSSEKPVKDGHQPGDKTELEDGEEKDRMVGSIRDRNQIKMAKFPQDDDGVDSENWPFSDSNIWEPIENLNGCEELVADFERRWAKRQSKDKSDKDEVEQTKGSPKKIVLEAKTSPIKKTNIEMEISPEISPESSTETIKVEVEMKETAELITIPKKEEFDVLEECPIDKIPKKLIGVVNVEGGLIYVIEWESQRENQSSAVSDYDEPDRDLIKSLPFKKMYPAVVIKYYESRIVFTNDPQCEELEVIQNLDNYEEIRADFERRWTESQNKNKSDKGEVEQTKGSPNKVVLEANGSPIEKTTIEKEIITEISLETSTETINVEVRKKTTEVMTILEERKEFDVLEECPSDKIPTKIMGVADVGGTLIYLIEWESQKENESSAVLEDVEPDYGLIKAMPFKTMYPALVINYYEGCTVFINNPQYEEDRVKEQQKQNSESKTQSRPKPGPSKMNKRRKIQ